MAASPKTLNNNLNNSETVADTTNTNNDSKKERVKQRSTFNKSFLNIYSKKNVYVGFRVSIDYLEKLDFIASRLRARNLSETIRESIDIVYGLLSGAKQVDAGVIVIQNPVVNINNVNPEIKAEAEAKSETLVEIPKEIIRIVERLYHLSVDNQRMPPLQRDLIKQLYNKILRQGVN
jgi:hypothetical protein